MRAREMAVISFQARHSSFPDPGRGGGSEDPNPDPERKAAAPCRRSSTRRRRRRGRRRRRRGRPWRRQGSRSGRQRCRRGRVLEIEPRDPDECPRPMGQKKAKKAAFEAKKEGKSKETAIDVENLDKFSKIQTKAHTNRLKVLEVQQKLSTEKLEASRLAHFAAMENKEAKKLEMEAKMMETYKCLLSRDTGGFSAEEKDEHVAALKCLRKRLFPN